MKTKDHEVNDRLPLLEGRLSELLLQIDGSTTRCLSALVGGALGVDLRLQRLIQYQDLPQEIQTNFSGDGPFLHRVSSLTYHHDTLSINAVFADVNLLTPELRKNIDQGKMPLGLLIANTECRRHFLKGGRMNLKEVGDLFSPIELPPVTTLVKKYIIIQKEKCWFYLCETFSMERILSNFLDINPQSP